MSRCRNKSFYIWRFTQIKQHRFVYFDNKRTCDLKICSVNFCSQIIVILIIPYILQIVQMLLKKISENYRILLIFSVFFNKTEARYIPYSTYWTVSSGVISENPQKSHTERSLSDSVFPQKTQTRGGYRSSPARCTITGYVQPR